TRTTRAPNRSLARRATAPIIAAAPEERQTCSDTLIAVVTRDISTLANGEFDLLVVGAGIYGATIAWEAAHRGLQVALIDRGDSPRRRVSARRKRSSCLRALMQPVSPAGPAGSTDRCTTRIACCCRSSSLPAPRARRLRITSARWRLSAAENVWMASARAMN